MQQQINVHEAKTHLSRLLEDVSEGGEVVIAKHGKPIARLVPYEAKYEAPRKLTGNWKGKVEINDDFDACDEEIAELFYNGKIFPD